MDENLFDVGGRVLVESLQVKLMQEAEIDSSLPLDPQVLRDPFIGVHAISLVSSKRNMRIDKGVDSLRLPRMSCAAHMVVTPGGWAVSARLLASQHTGGGTSKGWISGGILLREWIRYGLKLLR
jgi:hypothetical protein